MAKPKGSKNINPLAQEANMKTTIEEVKEALIANHGLMLPTAKSLGIATQTLQERFTHNPELIVIRDECRQEALDMAEHKLIQLIEEGDFRAINLFLRTIGKSRGYSETQNLNVQAKNTNTNNFDYSKLSKEELEDLERLMLKCSSDDNDDVLMLKQ